MADAKPIEIRHLNVVSHLIELGYKFLYQDKVGGEDVGYFEYDHTILDAARAYDETYCERKTAKKSISNRPRSSLRSRG